MSVEDIHDRLHKAIHRAPKEVSIKEFEEITAVILVALTELAAETALVIGEVFERIEALEASQKGQSKS